MRRILIVGSCGAGKSTLAIQLGSMLDIEVIHLDTYYWKPNWVKPSKKEWEQTVRKLIKRKAWVMDGNYRSTIPIRFPVADTIIFLDFPKWLCLWQSIKRRLFPSQTSRPDLAKGCLERLSWQFIKWILTYPRQEMIKMLESHAQNKTIIMLLTQRK